MKNICKKILILIVLFTMLSTYLQPITNIVLAVDEINEDDSSILNEEVKEDEYIFFKNNVLNETTEYLKYQLSNLDFEKDIKARMLCSMVIVMLEWKELKESD